MSNDDLVFPGNSPAAQVRTAGPGVKAVLVQKPGHEPISAAGLHGDGSEELRLPGLQEPGRKPEGNQGRRAVHKAGIQSNTGYWHFQFTFLPLERMTLTNEKLSTAR